MDTDTERQIIQLYLNGKSCNKIGKELNINQTTAFHVLKKYNVPMRTKGGIYPLDTNEIIALYKNGISSTQIAEKYKVTPHTITTILENNGIPRDNRYSNVNLNHHYFQNIDTHAKAYFLGFIIADGNIVETRPTLKITLKNDDSYILEVFKNELNSDNKVRHQVRHDKKNNPIEASFSIDSQQIVDDLRQYNVVPRKTPIATLPKIRDEFNSSLIRGLIDGDGWISQKSHAIGFCGNETIVNQVKDFLVTTLNVYPVMTVHHRTNLWMIAWASKKDVITIGDFIYQHKNNCYLQRKFDNYQAIKQTIIS